jgi:hypothetical protein
MKNKEKEQIQKMLYLKAYNDGFMSGMRLAWYRAEELLKEMPKEQMPKVQRLIDLLKS